MSALDPTDSIILTMERDKVMPLGANFVFFEGPEIHVYQKGHQLRMHRDAWEELGRPDTITVRVTIDLEKE